MEIGVFGATGVIGQRVVAEAVDRGHRITAFTRSAGRIPANANANADAGTNARADADAGEVRWRVADALDVGQVTDALGGLDVVVLAINAGDDVPSTIANAHVFPAAARTFLTAMQSHPALRLIVVGGAGSLEVRPGLRVVDTDGFAEALPAQLGVPVEYAQAVRAGVDALDAYRLSDRNWTYLSPSAGLIRPGERTGRFRVGGNQLLTSADGIPDISAEDLASAIVDEAETARHVQRRFTVGY